MCGIIGYIGKKNRALPVLVEGLKKLEYRGYDSAGVTYLRGTGLETVKAVGEIANLESKLELGIESTIGIGHTRWATHGVPNEVNSHPHTSGKITLVHNGIIENYAKLKEELGLKGTKFKSDTDTEVAAALLDSLYEECGDMKKTIVEFMKRVKGTYAIAALVEGKYDEIYVIKNLSPLIIGKGEDEFFVASDVRAILEYTNRYTVLEDGEFAKVSINGIDLFDKNGQARDMCIKTFDGDASSLDKGTFEHFMLKEIYEEPDVIERLVNKYSDDESRASLPDLKSYKSITVVACGSAMHAGLIGKYFIEQNLDIPVNVEVASEFKYKKCFLKRGDLVIAISQSGETADTLASVKIAKNKGIHTIGIVNVMESSISREVDEVIYTNAGSEVAVATTKAYVAQAMILLLMSLKNSLDATWKKGLLRVSLAAKKLIEQRDVYSNIARILKEHGDVFFIGRLVDYAVCMEGSLKLKEISYVHSEAYAAGELKHGTISLISDGTPVLAVITDKDIASKTLGNIKEVKARGAHVILIVGENIAIDKDIYDDIVVIPDIEDSIGAILAILPLQLIAYEVAKLKGCSIDKPRNLAKSVTVE